MGANQGGSRWRFGHWPGGACQSSAGSVPAWRAVRRDRGHMGEGAMSQLTVASLRDEISDFAGQETQCWDSKLVSLEQALATIRPGSRIYLGTGCAAPRNLLAGLEAMQPSPPDLEFVSFVTTSALPMKTDASHRHRTFFVGSDVQSLAESGQLDYVPILLEEVPALLASGRLPIDVALLQVSPPDDRGYVSLGVSVDLAPAVLSTARRVIAEVNPAMPRTHGESFVHIEHV